jgi:hypothetical protein
MSSLRALQATVKAKCSIKPIRTHTDERRERDEQSQPEGDWGRDTRRPPVKVEYVPTADDLAESAAYHAALDARLRDREEETAWMDALQEASGYGHLTEGR